MVTYTGFVYIWFDRHRCQFYIGSHCGTISDGYICSSVNLLRAYSKRPSDFKRRIIEFVCGSASDILEREQYWLDFIKVDELGLRYYNYKRSAIGGNMFEGRPIADIELHRSRMSAARKGKPLSALQRERIAAAAARPDVRAKKSASHKGKRLSEIHREAIGLGQRGKIQTAEHCANISKGKIGKPLSIEHRQTISRAKKGKPSGRLGSTMPESAKRSIGLAISSQIWITDGILSKRVPKGSTLPENWRRGRPCQNQS